MEEWINRAWTAALTAVPTLGLAWLWFRAQIKGYKQDALEARTAQATAEASERKAVAEARKQEVEVSAEEAELDHKRQVWALKEARDAYRDVRKEVAEIKVEMNGLVKSERDCQIRLATYITRDRSKTARIRELEKRCGIEAEEEEDEGLDQWADKTLTEETERGTTERDA